ncbi:hypothetical protein ACQ4OD_13165 [Pseudomonas sp. WC1]|uniref:hypothetical protein n=1 Tax=Pseudomonas sp. WC1 TaxID=3424772 RepID=UPI003D33CF85
MTSIICWKNAVDEWYPGVWAVADPRVPSHVGMMTDSLQKLFVLPVNLYQDESVFTREYSKRILNVCYGYVGSTLVGSGVKDILALCLDNLSEVEYCDVDGEVIKSIEERMPSLEEIAGLTKKITQKYLLALGELHPSSVRCEILIFGFCKRTYMEKAFLIKNSPQESAVVSLEELDFSDSEFFVLGDKKCDVLKEIERKRTFCAQFPRWLGRAPIFALQQIIKNSSLSSRGGFAQVCIATKVVSRTVYIADVDNSNFPLPGFDVFVELGAIGGFSISLNPSLTIDKRFID